MLMRSYAFLLILVLASGCVQVLAADYVVANKNNFMGREISVSGEVAAGNIMCTLIACDIPCCNACGGSLALKGSSGKIEIRGAYEGRPVGCFGNDCGLECYPMREERKYSVEGILKESYGELYIELKSFSEAG